MNINNELNQAKANFLELVGKLVTILDQRLQPDLYRLAAAFICQILLILKGRRHVVGVVVKGEELEVMRARLTTLGSQLERIKNSVLHPSKPASREQIYEDLICTSANYRYLDRIVGQWEELERVYLEETR